VTALEQVQRLRSVAEKLEKALRILAADRRIALDEEEWNRIRDCADLACWVFGPNAVDEERRAELRAVVEACEKLGEAHDLSDPRRFES
jgi:hypothetical protein